MDFLFPDRYKGHSPRYDGDGEYDTRSSWGYNWYCNVSLQTVAVLVCKILCPAGGQDNEGTDGSSSIGDVIERNNIGCMAQVA